MCYSEYCECEMACEYCGHVLTLESIGVYDAQTYFFCPNPTCERMIEDWLLDKLIIDFKDRTEEEYGHKLDTSELMSILTQERRCFAPGKSTF